MQDRSQAITEVFKEFASFKHAMMKESATFKPPIPPAQKEVLFTLAHNEGMTLKVLAKHLDITPGATTQLTEALVDAGLVTRQNDEKDRRVVHLSLSANGRKLIQKLFKSRRDLFKRLFENLSDAEIETFRVVIRKVNDNLQHKK
jgi:DNA-binding MarR family transcriptional regulator